jgi:hypothetical protein
MLLDLNFVSCGHVIKHASTHPRYKSQHFSVKSRYVPSSWCPLRLNQLLSSPFLDLVGKKENTNSQPNISKNL